MGIRLVNGTETHLSLSPIGFNDRTWLDFFGAPHSDAMHLEERYHRVDHDTIELTMTIDDPKTYTKPWVSDTKTLKLTPPEKFGEDFCVPSDEEKYKELMRNLLLVR